MRSERPVVELRGVAGRVGSTTILRDVDLEVGAGEAVGLYGGNGAGKTTLLRIVATLMRPAAGTATVLGADLNGPDRYDIRSQIGLIGHVPALYPELTLTENLDFAAAIACVAPTRVPEALGAVGLGNAADRRADACSHGMQRRAEFAREMMRAPDLLLLDEPHTALDPEAVDLVAYLVKSVTGGGGAVMVVSHDRARVDPMVDRTVELTGGSLR